MGHGILVINEIRLHFVPEQNILPIAADRDSVPI